ncbi:hypothetical protein JG687_00016502, partial [Phytophthora cactorum]
ADQQRHLRLILRDPWPRAIPLQTVWKREQAAREHRVHKPHRPPRPQARRIQGPVRSNTLQQRPTPPELRVRFQETSDRFQWLRWVVERNIPLSEVDNELTRSMSRWGAVSSRLLLNSMHNIAEKVGVNLEVILGICFGIM